MTSNLASASLRLLIMSSILAQSAAVFADTMDERQVNQEQRIQQGIQNGELNQREVRQLERGQEKIETREAQFEADGNIDPKEAQKLRKMQAKESRRIFRQKHDRQTAD